MAEVAIDEREKEEQRKARNKRRTERKKFALKVAAKNKIKTQKDPNRKKDPSARKRTVNHIPTIAMYYPTIEEQDAEREKRRKKKFGIVDTVAAEVVAPTDSTSQVEVEVINNDNETIRSE
jgi:hypothetical protein